MKLSQGTEQYLAWKHGNGYKCERAKTILIQMIKYIGDIELAEVRTEHLLACLNRTPIVTSTWVCKYWMLRRFFEYCSGRGLMPDLEMPKPRINRRHDLEPHIFTRVELRSLLEATKRNRRTNYVLDQLTFRTIIVLLYATGLSVGEVPTILETDADLLNGYIRIRSQYPQRDRRIPIGRDLCEVLREYKMWRYQIATDCPYLFVTRSGKKTNSHSISKNFYGLRRAASVRRRDESRYQPRISDLRFTFAVHRISGWIESGDDLNRLLPALAAYMGQVGLGSTARYLALTPERFRKNLDKLSNKSRSGHWRDDPDLMRFLGKL
jgi:integrase/recombinase XerD